MNKKSKKSKIDFVVNIFYPSFLSFLICFPSSGCSFWMKHVDYMSILHICLLYFRYVYYYFLCQEGSAESGSADMVMFHMFGDLFLWDWVWRPSVVANNNPIIVHVFFWGVGGYTLESFKIMHSNFSGKIK